MTDRIRDFLKGLPHEEPVLVVDLDVVRRNYEGFSAALPDSRIFYAVKANPAPEVLSLLAELGSSFDTASVQEIEMALAAGATPDRVSFGNTIKRESDIAKAYRLGVDLYAFDVGSQQGNTGAWDLALSTVGGLFRRLEARGVTLKMVNLGGGFPARYLKAVPLAQQYGQSIREALSRHFGNRLPETIIEPGRGMVGDAGVIRTEVLLISRKSEQDPHRWVYLDIGKFGGLAETMDEAIRYPIRSARDGDPSEPAILAGPTCDSADVMYEKLPYDLPLSLEIGDELFIEATGAYTTTYASVAFNGFAPLRSYCI